MVLGCLAGPMASEGPSVWMKEGHQQGRDCGNGAGDVTGLALQMRRERKPRSAGASRS